MAEITKNVIKMIDAYIDCYNLDKLINLENNIIKSTPLNRQEYEASDNKLTSVIKITNDELTGFIDKNQDHTHITNRLLENESDFMQRKKLYDVVTKYINTIVLFNNTPENQEYIFRFQYLINTFFNKIINELNERIKLKPTDIMFIYKGGTYMKIMFEKYKNELGIELKETLSPHFERSDSDYTIHINKPAIPDIKLYTEIYIMLNKLTYKILEQINYFINENLNYMLPLNDINDSKLADLINLLNTEIIKQRGLSSFSYFKDVKEIIGVTVYDKTFYNKQINCNLDTCYHSLNMDNSKMSELQNNSNVMYFLRNKKLITIRNPFVVTYMKEDDKLHPMVVNVNGEAYDSGIYQYYNETIRFINNGTLSYFNLHRLKLNTVFYYVTHDNKYGFMNCPGELVDVPIATYHDYKIDFDINGNIKKYRYKLHNIDLYYNSYTLYGIINDLYKIMVVDFRVPWDDIKYDKRIYRICFFILIYIGIMYKNVDEIKTFYINLLNTTNKSEISELIINIKLVKHDNTNINIIEDVPMQLLADIIHICKQNLLSDNDKIQYENMKQIITSLFNKFTQKQIVSDINNDIEQVNFMKKYLKYKNKYIQLRQPQLRK